MGRYNGKRGVLCYVRVVLTGGWCNCRVNLQSLLTALELGLGLGLEPSPLARVAKLVVGVVGVALRLR